jgi:uncharacterized protein
MINEFSLLSSLIPRRRRIYVAVSGGVDSMTLMAFVHSLVGNYAVAVHAVSPAVPVSSLQRIKDISNARGWSVTYVDANELGDADYARNPINRCYFCKKNLYKVICSLKTRDSDEIFSGTNLDDLKDYRPGLSAAQEFNVVHPFVKAGMGKDDVRHLAGQLGLTDLADLPASPCLASRVSTGIPIEPNKLLLIDAVERRVLGERFAGDFRFRINEDSYLIQIPQRELNSLNESDKLLIQAAIFEIIGEFEMRVKPVSFDTYKKGYSFRTDRAN